MEFPQYRRYKNNKHYFKITSESSFEELRILGRYYQIVELVARIHPDRVMIGDLLNAYHSFAEAITDADYEEKKDWCMHNLQPLAM